MTPIELAALIIIAMLVSGGIGACAAVLLVPWRVDAHSATLKADLAELTDKVDHAMKRQIKRDRDLLAGESGASPLRGPGLSFDARQDRAARLRAVMERARAARAK